MNFSLPFDLGSIYKRKNNVMNISHDEPDAETIIADHLLEMLSHVSLDRHIVVVCVGTDRSTGDALGPLIGSRLKQIVFDGFSLYGTLDLPVHAMNLSATMDEIKEKYDNPFIIAIDACLGKLSSVGHVQIAYGPIKPGSGVNKDLPPVGDMHITGVVNVGGFMEYFVLQNTRLSLVMNMAEVIANSLSLSIKNSDRFMAYRMFAQD
jgi:putative sporulation protein YyaC